MTARPIRIMGLAILIAVVAALLVPLAAFAHGGVEHATNTDAMKMPAPNKSGKAVTVTMPDTKSDTGRGMRGMATESAPTTIEQAIKVVYYVFLAGSALTLIATVFERPRRLFRRA